MPEAVTNASMAADAARLSIGQTPEELIRDRTDNVVRLFAERNSRPLEIFWSPTIGTLKHPLLARFAHICEGLLHADGHILAEDFDFGCFTPVHQWMVLVDVAKEGERFFYRHFGAGIADHFGADMTDRAVEDLDGAAARFFLAIYRSVELRGEALLCIHEPPSQEFVWSWRHLIVPLFDRGGRVARLVAISVPDNDFSPGLEIIPDPVMVVDEQQNVRYANRAARSLFGETERSGGSATLRQYCGFALETGQSPAEMFTTGAVENAIRHIRIGNHLADDFLVTVSAAMQSDRAFYLVMIRLVVT